MIAQEFRDKLMSALSSAVGHLNSGDDATTAVFKAASAGDFNAEQTRRLCETFNTARTLYHFEQHPNEKEASFPLADQDVVLQRVFKAVPLPKAAEAAVDLADYSEYEGREKDAFAGDISHLGGLPEPEEAQVSLNDQVRRAYTIVDSLNRLSKDAESEAEQADIIVAEMLGKLASEIATACDLGQNEKFARFVRCEMLQDTTRPMLQKLGEFLPKRTRVTSEELEQVGHVIDDRDLTAWRALFKEACTLAAHGANTRATAIAMGKEALAFERQFMGRVMPKTEDALEGVLDGFETKQAQAVSSTRPTYSFLDVFRPAPTTPDEIKSEQAWRDKYRSQQVTKAPGPSVLGLAREGVGKGVGDAAGAFITSGLEDVFGTKGVEQTNRKITDRLRNQQREVLLQELMTNDPFISEASPQTVAGAYQTIMRVAPEVSTQREIVRAILRQAIQSAAVSPYDAAAWADLEKTILETTGKLPQKPIADGGKRR